MNDTKKNKIPVDNSSILFFSLLKKYHANSYRFTMTLSETVDAEVLQQAVDRIYRRFPTVIAGFLPGFFHYFQFPAQQPPQVQPDPGVLKTMSKEELHKCAYRVYYRENTVSIEAFHALTDGYGAIASFTTLMAEYLRLKHGIAIPAVETVRNLEELPSMEEASDDYLVHQEGKPLHLPSRYAFQIPGTPNDKWQVLNTTIEYPAEKIVAAATGGVFPQTPCSAVYWQPPSWKSRKRTPAVQSAMSGSWYPSICADSSAAAPCVISSGTHFPPWNPMNRIFPWKNC